GHELSSDRANGLRGEARGRFRRDASFGRTGNARERREARERMVQRAPERQPGAPVMSVQVYGCNHVAIEVGDIEKAVAFYKDVFNLEQMSGGEGDAFFKLGEHQFLAIFEVDKVQRANVRHFGIMVRDEAQLEEVRRKLTEKFKLKLEPPFRCDFRDPWGNRIQVVDLHDESLVWLLPYAEVQKVGIKFDAK